MQEGGEISVSFGNECVGVLHGLNGSAITVNFNTWHTVDDLTKQLADCLPRDMLIEGIATPDFPSVLHGSCSLETVFQNNPMILFGSELKCEGEPFIVR